MSTFIRVAEVWVPSADGGVLELADGWFDNAPAFGRISREMCFGRDEGLPGRAWEEGRPILLRQFEGSYFRRIDAARAGGLSCALALPVFLNRALSSVLVLLCGEVQVQAGAIELWRNDPRITSDLRLDDGIFGGDTALEALTRDAFLPRGSGLPGLAWQREQAVFMAQLDEAPHFLRAETAADAGLVRGLAQPCTGRDPDRSWVLSLLSSQATPIARRVEGWLPDANGPMLQRGFGFCEARGRLSTESLPVQALGAIGKALSTGVAQVCTGPEPAGQALARELDAVGLRTVVAIPLVQAGADSDQVSEVVALYF
ncbi:MAG TPA: hypothetical protein VLA61_28510 [Ideonella sp.]|uniref:hypothetical protein n=1 Tax=Ideonella sp. TaxID=1929293 RepID=UPI002B7EB0DA|nr:hypothetical protein [Ideonella sp.]HSI52227.1 hypothetical protein [Ideonella sp.]